MREREGGRWPARESEREGGLKRLTGESRERDRPAGEREGGGCQESERGGEGDGRHKSEREGGEA